MITDPLFRQAVDRIDGGDAGGLRKLLGAHPDLVRQRVTFEGEGYFARPSLLEFVAENPIRHGRLPPNIVDVAEVIITAGADPAAIEATLGLVCSGKVARECGVQVPLIELLCSHGAEPDSAMMTALAHGEIDAASALFRRGAHVDLATAAALGRTEEVRRMLADADADSRHRALALAAQHGHAGIVSILLEAGEDANRYNPVGLHAHSTPLHQAALAGHFDVVRALKEHGARTDLRDTLFQGIAAEWATHGGHPLIAEYLDARP